LKNRNHALTTILIKKSTRSEVKHLHEKTGLMMMY